MKTKGSHTSQTALHSKIRFFPTVSQTNKRITVQTTSIMAAPIILHKTNTFMLSSHGKKKTSLKVKNGAQVHWMYGNLHPKFSKDIRIYFVPTLQERPSCCSVPLQQPQLRVNPHSDIPMVWRGNKKAKPFGLRYTPTSCGFHTQPSLQRAQRPYTRISFWKSFL